jgi:hypothetical protein
MEIGLWDNYAVRHRNVMAFSNFDQFYIFLRNWSENYAIRSHSNESNNNNNMGDARISEATATLALLAVGSSYAVR